MCECNLIVQQPPTWLRLACDWPKRFDGYCIVKWHLLVLRRIAVVSPLQFITSRNILTLSAQARGSSSLVQFWSHLVVNSTGHKASPVYCQLHVAYLVTCKAKAIPLQAGQALRVTGGWGSQISRQPAHEGGKVVSSMHRAIYPPPPGNIPSTQTFYSPTNAHVEFIKTN